MTCSTCGKKMGTGDLYCPHCDAPFNPKGKPLRPMKVLRQIRLLEIKRIALITLGFLAVMAAIIILIERAPLGGALNGEWVSEPHFRFTHEVIVVYEFSGRQATRTTHWPEGSFMPTGTIAPSDFRIFDRGRIFRHGSEPDVSFSRESEDVIIIDGITLHPPRIVPGN
ncbi:MAG: hypothetical protein FWC90_03410 [Oscillospiraceae bacterium]|nr:hypothetical protein [Oscillospiraceae bacterium]